MIYQFFWAHFLITQTLEAILVLCNRKVEDEGGSLVHLLNIKKAIEAMISKKIVEASEVELNTNQKTASGMTKPYSSLLYYYVMWNMWKTCRESWDSQAT